MKKLLILVPVIIGVIAGGAFFIDKQIENNFNEPCVITEKPFEYNAEPNTLGSPPDTYLVKVNVETTSLWTSVEVEGLQSVTVASYIPHKESNSDKNVSVDGLTVYELSRPETNEDILPPITAEYDAIVQKYGDIATFKINKEGTGTTIYKLYSVVGNSTKEIARFVHDGIGEDSAKTFILDTNLLSSPLSFPEEKYDGPLFDAHLHLTGQDSQDSPEGIEYTKLLINSDNADEIFTMFDTLGVTGLIGFLPLNHDFFVIREKKWTNPFLKQAMEIGNRYCGRIHPFLFPDSLSGIKSRKYFTTKLIDDYVKKYPIKGIGEIHVDSENPLYKDIRLNDDEMYELYDYAALNNLVVMIHPRESDLDDLHDALRDNPKTKVLLHSDEGVEKIIPLLIREHDNIYYSIDAGLMYPYSLPIDGMTKEEFLNNLHSDEMYHRILASALRYWKPLIEAHPDRIMWGTDALYSWHFDDDVYGEVTWFARDFIGGLSPEIQEKFAYKNADRLMGL
ncbi:MAG: amidohydrolase [Patescibacteria group bacterium]|nr:amidohydrolase [Patescibacteria group bacterium]